MHSHPKITTIIPTHRRPILLQRAIKSVLNQTYSQFQVCVYDNNSQDETADIVAEIARNDSRVKYYCHPTDIGYTANFNYGMSKVNTDFYSILSDDDLVLPNFYETALQGFERFPQAYFSMGEVIEMTEEGEFIRLRISSWPREGYYPPPQSLLEMAGREPGWTGTLFRRELIEEVGYLDPEVNLPGDFDFQLRAASKFPYVISKKPCAVFVNHHTAISSTTYPLYMWKGWLLMIDKIKTNNQIPQDVRLEVERKLREQLIGFLFGPRAVINKDFEVAYQTVEVLRDKFNQNFKAATLYWVTTLAKNIPFFHRLLILARTMYRRIRLVRELKSQRKYDYIYSQYMKG